MVIKLALSSSDYLTYQLYTASKSKRVKSNRRKSWLVVSAAFFVLGVIFYDNIKFYSFWFGGFGVISLIFYPVYARYYYKKHYEKSVLEHYGNKVGKESIIDFQPDYIMSKDVVGESKIYTIEVCEINEIGTHYFVKIKTGESLIVPKSIVHDDAFIGKLMEIFNNPAIKINKELDWKWR